MPKKPTVRTRFAPSPTGMLHLGALRTALFKFLFARHQGGVFILRIDDTDRLRLVKGAEEQIIQSLQSLGLDWDEGPDSKTKFGPYRQSERKEIYQKFAAELTEKGDLYPCWCSPERLDKLRREAQIKQIPFKYDRHCLKHPGDISKPHVLRFKMPDQDQKITWHDAVKGKVEFDSQDLDDFVAIKSDGWPTYHFSSVVDDHAMEITHVIRGDEWVASTPKHLLVYQAFGWQAPVFAHTPVILGPDGKRKLSKRDGVKSVSEYLDEGYLPEALVNFLALLGWHPGEGETQEVFSLKQLISEFRLERIQKSPAKFDPQKLEWMNGLYIRNLSLDDLLAKSQGFWPAGAKKAEPEYQKRVLALVQERMKFLAELPELTDFFFADPEADKAMTDQLRKISSDASTILNEVTVWLDTIEFAEPQIEKRLRDLAENGKYKTGQLFGLIRVAVTGKTAAPGLFETLATLGKDNSLRRLHNAIDALLK